MLSMNNPNGGLTTRTLDVVLLSSQSLTRSSLCDAQASSELAATYAALILADEGIEITADKILALTEAASVELEPIWASLLAKALEGKNVKDLLSNVGAGGGVPAVGAPVAAAAGGAAAAEAPKEEEKKEEAKEESDDDMGFGLFD
ncbi:60s acidic ribosomal protein-domain-containing protein [Suillus subaureus]|uniref:60s acidic ribosomal protein-domain-containing protein n=1 Tax=Suillus subaureus TaxID=48587 RepID=A0A9P7JA95_9AGAM|nr:60s acidic ribosomal protein-domain-containing protein [Suillus subaureus]KAG1811246.1 60s acidic ribosomal protein-domain-containing protein [Suillus subaureus]